MISSTLLYLILVVGIQSSPTWDAQEPCGPWTAVCDAALGEHGLDPHAYAAPTGYQWTWRQTFGWVMWCESRFDPFAIGDHGHSRGLWQWSDTYQPDVLPILAFNPWASTYRAARDWAAGLAVRWSCYRILVQGE